MNIKQGDIFQVKQGMILSQVNCQGAHGRGLTATINKLYPQVKEEYMDYCASGRHPNELLGEVLLVRVSPSLQIACCFGQLKYGGGAVRYTNYGALAKCFINIAKIYPTNQVHIPYLIGCGLAQGDTETVGELIDFLLPDATVWQYNL